MSAKYYRAFLVLKEDSKEYSLSGRCGLGRAVLEGRESLGKVSVSVQDLKPMVKYELLLVCCREGASRGIVLGTLHVNDKAKGEGKYEFDADNIKGCGISLSEVNVVVIRAAGDGTNALLWGCKDGEMNWKPGFTVVSGGGKQPQSSAPVPAAKPKPETLVKTETHLPSESPVEMEAHLPPEECDAGNDTALDIAGEMPAHTPKPEDACVQEFVFDDNFEAEEDSARTVKDTDDWKYATEKDFYSPDSIPAYESLGESDTVSGRKKDYPDSFDFISADFQLFPEDREVCLEDGREAAPLGIAADIISDTVIESVSGTVGQIVGKAAGEIVKKAAEELIEAVTEDKQQEKCEDETGRESFQADQGTILEIVDEALGKAENIHKRFQHITAEFDEKMEALEISPEPVAKIETSADSPYMAEGEETVIAVTSDIDRLFEKNPPMVPFEKQQNPTDWIRISLKDMAVLPIDQREYANNPMIHSSYKRYRHLLLGRMNKEGEIKYILGIPDLYSSYYAPTAESYGFRQFKYCDANPPQSESHGYWLMIL